jgi:hypothetical protein
MIKCSTTNVCSCKLKHKDSENDAVISLRLYPTHAALLFAYEEFAGNWPEISPDIPVFDQCSGC